ncbi:Cthe_2314 family HEPN domain-containing protein [Bacillus salacetis]|uniref:Cthe_2314 family HEPN domain-containing protein n=1 Tax=Bacillus salacetis TaxID=2315464 RepID=UPI003B9F8EAC
MGEINISPFEGITEVDFKECTKESPLKDFELPKGMFQKEDDHFMDLDNWDTQHWERLLENRLLSVERNFGYTMFYYYKGIPDDEWYMSPGKNGQSVQYYPHFDEEHYSNHYNFTYFVDTFFLKSYTLYETIGHLLFKVYNFEIKEDDPRDQVSFNSAIFKLKNVNRPLYKDLNKVKYTDDFQIGVKMRNDIAHNYPPYHKDSGIRKINGVEILGVGKYTTSSEIKAAMIGFLRGIKATVKVLDKHLPIKKTTK